MGKLLKWIQIISVVVFLDTDGVDGKGFRLVMDLMQYKENIV